MNILEKLKTEPERWGKPFAALLGAFDAQLELNAAAIGGKDSMSGTFLDKDVPPTLISFAIAPIKKQERRVAEPALRYLHRNAAKVTPDSQGRILLPQALLDFAGIKKNAVVVGNCDCVEIWSEALYEAEIENENRDDLRAKLELLGL